MQMTKYCAFAIMAMVAVQPKSKAADPDHPLSKLEKGQWIEYSTTGEVLGKKESGTRKLTVISKDEKSLTLEWTGTNNGAKQNGRRHIVDLTKAFSPLSDLADNALDDVKEENGKETLEIAGKKYECEWTKYTGKIDVGFKITQCVIKIWFCRKKPLGVVRMETKMDVGSEVLEMANFGKE